MKLNFLSFLTVGLLICFSSCNESAKTPTPLQKEVFSGYVQKGPYLNGSSVQIFELNASLNQTGRSYSTTVAGNSGSFEQKQIELVSNYVQLKADGYYFNEVTGKSSTGQLTLYALADISQVNSANVNVLTHLEKSRVEYLVQEKGIDFGVAKKQAQTEVLKIFNLSLPTDSTSESLNLSASGENNAILLAVSCILQGPLSTADMSELMANIISDIKTDGTLDNSTLGSTLLDNARLISLPAVRQHLVAKYTDLGLTNIIVPDFESKVREFVSKTTYQPAKIITYPVSGSYGLNILNDTVKAIPANSKNYSLKAELPQGTNLRIVLKGDGGAWSYGSIPLNWTVSSYDRTLHSQEFIVTESQKPTDLRLVFCESYGNNVTIEYYENNSLVPTRVKKMTIGNVIPTGLTIIYPKMGNIWENILSDSIIMVRQGGKIYSMRAEVPQGKKLKVVLSGASWICVNNPSSVNWTFSPYDNSTMSQEFNVTEGGKVSELGIVFTSASSIVFVNYYEDNSPTPTKGRKFVVN